MRGRRGWGGLGTPLLVHSIRSCVGPSKIRTRYRAGEKSPRTGRAKAKTVAIQRPGSLENYIHHAHPYRSAGCANRTRGALTGRSSQHRATAAKATSCVPCLRGRRRAEGLLCHHRRSRACYILVVGTSWRARASVENRCGATSSVVIQARQAISSAPHAAAGASPRPRSAQRHARWTSDTCGQFGGKILPLAGCISPARRVIQEQRSSGGGEKSKASPWQRKPPRQDPPSWEELA